MLKHPQLAVVTSYIEVTAFCITRTLKFLEPVEPQNMSRRSTVRARDALNKKLYELCDRHCGLVVRVPGYRVRLRFPALPDFLRSSGSGTGSTQPREYN
jgi:hypothetical protein